MKELIGKINSIIRLSPAAEEYIFSIAHEKKIAKGEVLISQGQAVNKTIFVVNGSLRSYCIDKNGKEHTLQFAIKNCWISDFMALYTDQAATLTVECITDSSVIEFKTSEFEKISSQFPEFEIFLRKALERHVVSIHKRTLDHLQLTALERYNVFLNQYPNIEQHISNYHIASYLGITPQSLSRIRKSKKEK